MYPTTVSSLLLLFSLSALVTGVPQNRPPVDVVIHNNYKIYNCGSQAPAVQSVLDLTARYLRDALTSTTASNPVYSTFFHGVPPARVRSILRKIISGTSVSAGGHSLEPVIMCTKASAPNMRTFVAQCMEPNVQAGWVPNTPFTFICHSFTNVRTIPPADGCPEVLRGKYLSGGHNMAFSQVTILVHELAHLYLGRETLMPEVYDANPAMRLPPEAASRNAQNYALFIGSGFRLPLMLSLSVFSSLCVGVEANLYLFSHDVDLIAKCTNFPTDRGLGRDHELLEVDPESHYSSDTLQLEPGCASGSVQAVLGLCQLGA